MRMAWVAANRGAFASNTRTNGVRNSLSMNKFVGIRSVACRVKFLYLAFASFLVVGAGVGIAADAIENSYRIESDGQTIDFEIARDEVESIASPGESSSLVIPMQVDANGVVAQADLLSQQTGNLVELVLYPVGAPRNEFTRRVLTRSVLAKFRPQSNAAAIATAVQAQTVKTVPYAPGYHILTGNGTADALAMAQALRAHADVLSANPMLARKQQLRFTPNDLLFTNQWHLLNTGQSNAVAGVDVNITNIWDSYTGSGVVIAIVDSGVQVGHPDLLPNVNTIIDFDYINNDADPSPGQGVGEAHGTSVAGVAAAAGNNMVGVTGVAFDSTIVGIRLIGGFLTDSQEANAMLHSNQVVQVSNNSWGPSDSGFFVSGPGPLMEAAFRAGTLNGRGGLGSIFTWAGGNGNLRFDNVNYDGYANSIYTIAVGALDNAGEQADYSESGAALIVSAPSGGEQFGRAHATTTTDTVGAAGFNSGAGGDLADADYTEVFNGTSSATPVVSGVVALMLESNPNLGWRDVQEILIRSARQNDFFDGDWINNGAGFHFNNKYGAGMVDAQAAVNLAQGWANLAEQIALSALQTNLNLAIPDLAPNGVLVSFDITAADFRAEHVTVTIDTAHSFAGDLEMILTSPSGTESRLSERDNAPLFDYNNWKLMTVRNWGELARGTWTLRVSDRGFGGNGSLQSARMEIWGSSTNTVPSLTISDATIAEGNQGFTNAVFLVNLSQPISSFLNVSYTTGGGAATPAIDYTPQSGTLIFAPGQTNLTISVPVVGELLQEQNETFFVSLFNAGEAQISDEVGLGTILNDDGPVWIVSDASVVETDAGLTNMVFDLSISEASLMFVSVAFQTVDATATNGLDYIGTNGIVTLFPGVTNQTVSVAVIGDAILEPNETFFLQLTNATASSALDAEGIGTIVDDEPRIQVEMLSVAEGNAGLHDVILNVTLSKPGLLDIGVEYATTNLSARAGSDYTATSGVLSFAAGLTNKIITVQANGDLFFENDEAFGIRLFNATNAAIATNLTLVTLTNDDAAPQLSIVDGAGIEGDTGTNTVAITVNLDVPSGLLAAVDFTTGVGTASVDVDYQATSGTLIFQPGTTSRTVAIKVRGDTIHEQDEIFTFTLSSPRNAEILDGDGQGQITNDDSAPAISIADLSITEGDLGLQSAVLTLVLSSSSGLTITLDHATSDLSPMAGAATAGGDYVAIVNQPISIPPGSTTAIVPITINGDMLTEDNESFFVNLSNPVNATITDNQAQVSILNDDGPVLSVSDVTLEEGNSGTVNAFFTVALSEISAEVVTVAFSTVDGTATAADNDYAPVVTPGTLKFTSGDTSLSVSIPINGDTNPEATEFFEILLSNAVNATITDARGTVTIEDDDTLADLEVMVVNAPAASFVGHDFTYTITVMNNGAFAATNVLVTNLLPAAADLIAVSFPQTAVTNLDGSLGFSIDSLAIGASAVMTVVVRPQSESVLVFTAGGSSDQPDPNEVDNVATLNHNAVTPMLAIASSGAPTVVSESRAPANGSVDPGETITLSVGLINTGNVNATNIVATLSATGGVTAPSAAQSYGPIAAGGAATARAFTFTADSAATGSIDVTLSLVDVTSTGSNDLGQFTFNYALPARSAFANVTTIVIPQQGNAAPYPATINVTGLIGVIDTVTVVMTNLNHTFPADLDILLVGPAGNGVVLLSDAGRGEDLVEVSLTFLDSAAQVLPRLEPIVSGSYRPTDHVENQPDVFNAAPAGPYGNQLSAFSGGAPNGVWSLYVVDDAGNDMGNIVGGWSIVIDTVDPVSSSAGLSVSMTASPNPLLVGSNLVYTITVANEGPNLATGLTITEALPAEATIVSATYSIDDGDPMVPDTVINIAPLVNPLVIPLAQLTQGRNATIIVTVRPNAVGRLTNTVTAFGAEFDLFPANNTAVAVTQVNRVFTLAPMDLDTDLSNGFQLMLQGQGGLTYVIEVSTDLRNWTPVSTNVTFDGTINFNDVGASGMNRRFYRAVER